MKKRLHLLVGMLLLTLAASAQFLSTGGTRVLPTPRTSQQSPLMRFEQAPRFAPRRAPITIDPDRQMWWGYNGNADPADYFGVGTATTENYWVAIQVPESESLTQGKTIKALRIALAGAPCMKDLHIWISEQNLPNSIDDCVVDVPVTNILDWEFNEVELPTPYTIPNKTIYIGYTVTVTENSSDSNYPILFSNGDESLWIRTSQIVTSWSEETSYGPPFIQALLDGDNFPHNAVQISKTFADVFALVGGKADAAVTLTSQGLGTINSIDYIVGDANADGDEQHLEVEPFVGLGTERQVRIPLTADAEPGRTPRYITVTKVNGVENTIENATSDGYIVSLSEAAPRRTVVEEFTGTWCGWCPRGIVGMEKVNEQFGDKAITIVVHGDDPMAINYGIGARSYPYAYVDRGIAADPFFGINDEKDLGILDLVAERNSILSEAKVSLQQPTLAKNGTITFKTDVTFLYDNTKAPYAIGYVLLQDGLKGTGRDWAQANYYNSESAKEDFGDCPSLKPWFEAEKYVSMTYDHVAIAAKGMDLDGGGISAPIKKDVQRTLNSSISINENAVLQGFDNLKVVVILFNTETGFIVNADIQPVKVADDFSQNRMQIKAFEQAGALKGESAKAVVPVANFGRNGVQSIDYYIREGQEDSEPMHYDLPKPITSYGLYENVEIPLPARNESGLSNITLFITKVNGADNEATSGKSAKGSVLTVAKFSKRRTVIEEFTGTWCMWCPRGMAALKRLHAEYPDDAVLMAIHGGRDNEPMKVAAFNTQISSISGFPSAHVNRYLTCDPMYGSGEEDWGIIDDIQRENSQVVEASVELHQPTMEKSTGVISYTTDVTFQINRTSAPYLLTYVLVADGLKGEGDDWKQTNAYAAYYYGSYADDPYMNEICNVWDVYADVTYDHVAIASNGIDNGVAGSIKTTVEEGQTQTHSGKFATKSNALAKKATKLRVLALLYDKTRKVFINADEKEVVVVDAVDDLPSTASQREAALYSIDGKQLAAPTRGINIIRMADGTVRKVLVK